MKVSQTMWRLQDLPIALLSLFDCANLLLKNGNKSAKKQKVFYHILRVNIKFFQSVFQINNFFFCMQSQFQLQNWKFNFCYIVRNKNVSSISYSDWYIICYYNSHKWRHYTTSLNDMSEKVIYKVVISK